MSRPLWGDRGGEEGESHHLRGTYESEKKLEGTETTLSHERGKGAEGGPPSRMAAVPGRTDGAKRTDA